MSGERLSLDPRHAVKSHPFGIINRTKLEVFLFFFFFLSLFQTFLCVARSKFIQNTLEFKPICLNRCTFISIYIFLNLFKQRKRIYTLYKYILIFTIRILNLVHVLFMCTCKGILFCLWLIIIAWNWNLLVLEKMITDISRKLSIVVKNLSHLCLQILPRRYFLHRQYKGEVVVGNRK